MTSVKSKKSKPQKKISKEMMLAEVMRCRPDSIEKLLRMGLGCCGCSFAQMETLEQGCIAHGLDVKEVLKKLNN